MTNFSPWDKKTMLTGASIVADDAGGAGDWTADVAGIAHDLRAPLSVFDGYTRMLAAGDLGPISESAQRALTVMTGKVAEMRSLLDTLLDATRPAEALAEPQDRPVLDLADVAAQAVSRAEPRAKLARQRLDLVVADQAPVRADPRLLGRILDNLINNALVHTGVGRSVTVAVQRDGRYGQVRVQDDGPGMPADARARLFSPVPRDSSDAPPSRGSGLGLYFCRALAARVGASLTLEPAAGRGLTFRIELPLA